MQTVWLIFNGLDMEDKTSAFLLIFVSLSERQLGRERPHTRRKKSYRCRKKWRLKPQKQFLEHGDQIDLKDMKCHLKTFDVDSN